MLPWDSRLKPFVPVFLMDALIVAPFKWDNWTSRVAETVAIDIARLESKNFILKVRGSKVNDGTLNGTSDKQQGATYCTL